MIKTFATIKPFINLKRNAHSIDNFGFKLHYRWSFTMLTICTILVTSQQYFGEHIKCITGGSIPTHVIETFCFFTSTYTVVHQLNNTLLRLGAIPHPGVGPLYPYQLPKLYNLNKGEEIKRHAYYQWVPFVLFAQALLFLLPHYLWKKCEGGKIKSFSNGLKNITISRYINNTQQLKVSNFEYPSKDTIDGRLQGIKISFNNHLKCYVFWAYQFMLCEILNILNVIIQIYAMDKFLKGQFLNLGIQVIKQNWRLEIDILDIVFPKMTKCNFYKYGSSGSIQHHDALCIMALNIINEKIYTFLWFWYLIVLIASILAVIWRFIILIMYKNSSFTSILYSYSSPGKLDRNHVEIIIQKCNFSNWMFLYFLGASIDGFLFRELLQQLAFEFQNGISWSENNILAGENLANHQKISNGDGDDDNNVHDKLLINKQKPIDTVDSSSKLMTSGIDIKADKLN